MAAPIIADRLTKLFGETRAAQDVSFSVDAGEVFGFLGPNGAGKSTTIRVLLGLLRPTSGRAELLGRPPRDPESRRRVGFLPSDLPFDPKRTGREQIALFSALRGGVDPAEVDALCERFSLDPTRRIGTLSRGNRQKVGVVLAFMSRPDVLVLDEPTTGLDPLLQAEFQRLVREATDRGAAVLMSSHVLPEVEQIADRVGVIREGRMLRVSTVAELRRSVRQHLTITLANPPDALTLPDIPGLVSAELHHGRAEIAIEGAVQPLLDALRPYSIERVSSSDDLEHVFLDLYRDQDDAE